MTNPEMIQNRFSVVAQKYPDRIALKFKERELSYKELDEITNKLAHLLISKGVKADSIIPICIKNPIDMVIGIWGILKAGGAMLPIDPDFPAERIRLMIEEADTQLVVTDNNSRNFIDALNEKEIVSAANNWSILDDQLSTTTPPLNTTEENLAYVIYTSGSTGLPKGVLIKHKSLKTYLDGLYNTLPYASCSSYALGTTFTTDFVVTQLFTSLTHGALLHLFTKDDYNDLEYIHSYYQENKIDCLDILPSHWASLSWEGKDLLPRKILTFAGEALRTELIAHIIPSDSRDCMLVNCHGPTETTVGQLLYIIDDSKKYGSTVPIGKPFTDSKVYIINENGSEVLSEGEGELFIGGSCVAAGYLKRPSLTAERFVKKKFNGENEMIFYRTGDIVRRLSDSNIEFVGRIDDQVKIRGFRIELGEIETVLQKAPDVKQGVVLAKEGVNGDKRLIAYVTCSKSFDKKAITEFLQASLPEHMVPKLLVHLNEFPLLANGKIDKRSLPNPVADSLLTNAYVNPSGNTERLLSSLWKEILTVDRAGADDNFFELGGTSLLALKFIASLKSHKDINLSIVKLYQYPKLRDLANFIDGKTMSKNLTTNISKKADGDEIAVIGMSGRFPGADSIDELWEVLKEGKETITFFGDDELETSTSNKKSPDYVKARGILNDVKSFDPNFFGISTKHAELMDPQQRIFLEIAWEALERAGYTLDNYDGEISVFSGVNFNTYYTNNVLSHPQLIENAGNLQTVSLNDKDYVASRTAYALNLKGAAINVQSACSTSLVAVVQAVQSIRSGQCDMALAGGASISVPINVGHLYEEGAMFSKDGHCRPFDADATGTLFSDGAGVVLLKRKEQAIQDGDTIYAVIKGIGLSNDGGGKGSFSAPSVEGQAAAISRAINDAGIAADNISYIETHGTATPLGDPIEIEGLKMAFGDQSQKQFCAIGSVKSNFGHLTIAAGVAGLIKTCLALHHKKLPASINFNSPNPHIDFENSPFYVNSKMQNWDCDKTRIAGVSSFGVGGTNAHVIVEEMPVETKQPTNSSSQPQLICWSAKSEKSVMSYGDKLASYFKNNDDCNLADAAYSLQTTKKNFNERRFIVATDTEDLIQKLNDKSYWNSTPKNLSQKSQQVVFMFPGQGDQYMNMCKSLYENQPIFKKAMDECAVLLQSELKENILDIIYPNKINDVTTARIHQTRYSQPALFSIGYALGKLWTSWGIQPSAFIGHSIGEFVAAYFSGVFSLKDALWLIASRGKMMNELPSGKMLSVRLSFDEVQSYLSSEVELAASNSPLLSVLAGNENAINNISAILTEKEIPNKILSTSHAFHSYMMDSAVAPFEALVKNVSLNEPLIQIVSTVTGEWLTKTNATDPSYWSNHLRKPVLFNQAIKKLINEDYSLFLELGPGKAASTFTRQEAIGKSIAVISSIEKEENSMRSDCAVLTALGHLWSNGVAPDWNAVHGNERRKKITDLPTYAYDKQEYWLENISRNNELSLIGKTNEPLTEENNLQQQPISGKDELILQIKEILENASGADMKAVTTEMSLIQIGLDSLALTQVATMLKKKFSVAVTFRQLNEQLGTIELLTNYLKEHISYTNNASKTKQSLTPKASHSTEEAVEINKPFGAIARIEKKTDALSQDQQNYLDTLTLLYNNQTKTSKDYTQRNRAHMADPRVVSGFKPATKELTYSIVVKKSKDSRVWDIDGNEYIDALNGFGSNMLGHQPDFLKKALLDQVENGYEIGPQHELAADVCKLICEFTKFDRSALCNTGSEAVLGAIRIARTVTARPLIVSFSGSYHGIIDEVIARGSKKLTSYPAAPGIMPEAVQNMLILEYGTEESLRIIEERIDEIAAVLVEPVQSRRCDFQPISFLKKLRNITKQNDCVLVFDEVISGFRFHPGGVQAMFGIKADIATYGKVVGGGLPIGVIAGEKKYMDALDGGWWQYGDDSMPEVGVTYFAGTFVRHPLALATTKASLEYFKAEGPALQERLNAHGQYVANEISKICIQQEVPITVTQFGSLWKLKFLEEYPYSELLFVLMRLKGIHIMDGFPCFITAAHTEADLERIIKVFEESIVELKKVNFIPYYKHTPISSKKNLNTPPVPFAKLGKDKYGNPAWFIKDEKGKYLQVIV